MRSWGEIGHDLTERRFDIYYYGLLSILHKFLECCSILLLSFKCDIGWTTCILGRPGTRYSASATKQTDVERVILFGSDVKMVACLFVHLTRIWNVFEFVTGGFFWWVLFGSRAAGRAIKFRMGSGYMVWLGSDGCWSSRLDVEIQFWNLRGEREDWTDATRVGTTSVRPWVEKLLGIFGLNQFELIRTDSN